MSYMSVREVAELLDISPSTVYNWVRTGKVASSYEEGNMVLPQEEVDRLQALPKPKRGRPRKNVEITEVDLDSTWRLTLEHPKAHYGIPVLLNNYDETEVYTHGDPFGASFAGEEVKEVVLSQPGEFDEDELRFIGLFTNLPVDME